MIKPERLLYFFQQLTTLLTAGLPLTQSLQLLAQTEEAVDFRSLVQGLRLELRSGKGFHQSLERFPQYFDPLVCRLIKIGEQTGKLEEILKRLCDHQENALQRRRHLKKALLYPFILIVTALLTTLSMLLFVVPHFALLFERFPEKIPALTRGVIFISEGLRASWPWLLASLLVLGFLLRKTSFRLNPYRLPYLRTFYQKIALASFTRNLAIILNAALPLTEALILVSSLSTHPPLREAIRRLHGSVNAGNRFHSALEQNPLFPALLVQLTRTGEESGLLDRMLERYAEILEAEIERQTATFHLLLEPLIITMLGVLIGGIVIAMYLPIFHLGTAI